MTTQPLTRQDAATDVANWINKVQVGGAALPPANFEVGIRDDSAALLVEYENSSETIFDQEDGHALKVQQADLPTQLAKIVPVDRSLGHMQVTVVKMPGGRIAYVPDPEKSPGRAYMHKYAITPPESIKEVPSASAGTAGAVAPPRKAKSHSWKRGSRGRGRKGR